MRPSLDDWIIRECTDFLRQDQRGFVYRCLWTALRHGSWRLALRLTQLLLTH